MKKLALVLGGGSAKGYAHIGVIKQLEKQGLKPDLIVGTSMGALVGGMYAAGKKIEEIEQMALKFTSMGSFSLISTLFKDNILNIDKIKKILKMLEPITLPTAISLSPFFAAIIEVTNSGNEVPKATIVKPIILSEILNL